MAENEFHDTYPAEGEVRIVFGTETAHTAEVTITTHDAWHLLGELAAHIAHDHTEPRLVGAAGRIEHIYETVEEA